MLARAVRLLVSLAVVGGVAYVASLYSRRAALVSLLVMLAISLVVLVWLPRAAHRAFRQGRFVRARFLYHVLRWLRIGRDARASVAVSLAACALGEDRQGHALEILEQVDPERLGEAVRAAWLNNRAYALARAGQDPEGALDDSDRAIELRPEVAGFRHTRGLALLGLGRVDEAIRELDSLWSRMAGDDAKSMLEAERCYDLGLAWRAKGEHDYANDYFDRARRAAPDSVWARRAREYLDEGRKLAQLEALIDPTSGPSPGPG